MIGTFWRLQAPVIKEEANAICRNSDVYPVKRLSFPKDKVSWGVSWPEYAPPNYSAPHLSTASWADPDITDEKFQPEWNEDDDGIDRRSYVQSRIFRYEIVDGLPLNPKGRTGLSGRGRLGRWGPNHAADAVVTRFKYVNGVEQMDDRTGHPILQFIAILRKDCNKWAIPGGFVNPKEKPSTAALRELFEEAVNIEKLTHDCQKTMKGFFKGGEQFYKGYVDDPRNTDNAWIETTAINYHDYGGELNDVELLDGRDDAADAKWVDIVKELDIYPPHFAIMDQLRKKHFPGI